MNWRPSFVRCHLLLGSCNSRSLKRIELTGNQLGDWQLIDIILASSMHPKLEYLELGGMNAGRNDCTALADLLGIPPSIYKHSNYIETTLMMA